MLLNTTFKGIRGSFGGKAAYILQKLFLTGG